MRSNLKGLTPIITRPTFENPIKELNENDFAIVSNSLNEMAIIKLKNESTAQIYSPFLLNDDSIHEFLMMAAFAVPERMQKDQVC